jgi:hypothetical protein
MKAKIFIVVASLCALTLTSCREKFADMNQDPSKITESPAPDALFTYPLYRLSASQYTEWFYDNYQYMMPWSQVTNLGVFNRNDLNEFRELHGREWVMYMDIFANLFEMRKQIDEMDETAKAVYQKVYATTYILQIIQALKVTDVYGSIIYSQAMKGRYEGIYTAEYDTQEELFTQFLTELDFAITILTTNYPVEQISFLTRDFVYQGDVTRWVKAANTLKLRIAARMMRQNPTTAKAVIAEVAADPTGPIVSTADEFRWAPSAEYRGEAFDLWGPPYASKNMTEFLKKNQDPRLRIWFERNQFDQATVDNFVENGRRLPWFIKNAGAIDEPWDRYFGAPASPDSATPPAGHPYNDYSYDFKDPVTDASRMQISIINRRLQNPRYDNGTGYFVDVIIPASEACLYFAEFIETGAIAGPVKGKTAREWYEEGVRLSCESFDYVADKAIIKDLATLRLQGGEVTTLLARPDYAWGSNNLEKIYIQQYLAYFRLPTDLWTNVRRTGFPSFQSTILQREHMKSSTSELIFPRRFPRMPAATNDWNIDFYNAGMAEQGFTLDKLPVSILNTERLWFDKNAPDYGQGTAK